MKKHYTLPVSNNGFYIFQIDDIQIDEKIASQLHDSHSNRPDEPANVPGISTIGNGSHSSSDLALSGVDTAVVEKESASPAQLAVDVHIGMEITVSNGAYLSNKPVFFFEILSTRCLTAVGEVRTRQGAAKSTPGFLKHSQTVCSHIRNGLVARASLSLLQLAHVTTRSAQLFFFFIIFVSMIYPRP